MSKILTADGRKNDIGGRIRKLRENHGLSQEALMGELQLLGFDGERGVVKRMENGTRYINELEIRILARYFEVTYDYLLDGIEDDTKKE